MGDVNQFHFIQQRIDEFSGPYLEIGSRNYGSTQDLRSFFASSEKYVGIDMLAGDGVDLVLDLTGDFEEINEALDGARFETIFCLSVMEHCEQPFRMSENISRLLKPGGKLCLSVPFAWQFHGYPSDYWRFTHEGVKKLFPDLEFDLKLGISTSSQIGDEKPLNEDIGKIPLSPRFHRERGHLLRGLSAGFFRNLSKLGLFRWLTGYRYVMAPTMLTMIGTPKAKTKSQAA